MKQFPVNLAEVYWLFPDKSVYDRGKRYANEGRVMLNTSATGDRGEGTQRRLKGPREPSHR